MKGSCSWPPARVGRVICPSGDSSTPPNQRSPALGRTRPGPAFILSTRQELPSSEERVSRTGGGEGHGGPRLFVGQGEVELGAWELRVQPSLTASQADAHLFCDSFIHSFQDYLFSI